MLIRTKRKMTMTTSAHSTRTLDPETYRGHVEQILDQADMLTNMMSSYGEGLMRNHLIGDMAGLNIRLVASSTAQPHSFRVYWSLMQNHVEATFTLSFPGKESKLINVNFLPDGVCDVVVYYEGQDPDDWRSIVTAFDIPTDCPSIMPKRLASTEVGMKFVRALLDHHAALVARGWA